MRKSNELVQIIKKETDILFRNFYSQIEQVDLNQKFDGLPNSRYLFHALHSADQWFINPDKYKASSTDISGVDEVLSIIDQELPGFSQRTDVDITAGQLRIYAENVQYKIQKYLDTLTDDMLSEVVEEAKPYTRLDLILAQYRHIMFHIGLSTGVSVDDGKPWPEFSGYERTTDTPGI